jgi:cell division cycle protein 20 (cofactor of APC complex)
MRSVSSASLASSSTAGPTYSESSAKHHLRNAKLTIDFSVPPSTTVADPPLPLEVAAPLLSCSAANMSFFSRGNRVHYKNVMTMSEDVGQLCKLQDSHGDLRIVECGGVDQPDVVALGTSKGLVQIWDAKAKKKTASWSTKGVTAMRWNGPVLTVGGLKGTIRHYDTRVASTSKMKEQARKVTRHQARITSLEWNVDGKILASGDQSGTVYCWDSREKVPLDVGEFIQRRKKMQHCSPVSVGAPFCFVFFLLSRARVEGMFRL